MDSAAIVNQAAEWANFMVLREARGPGDLPNAMERLERRYGIAIQTFWALRYRRPKDLLASVYLRLQAAHRAEVERQLKKLEHELAITAAIAGPHHPVVAAVEAVVGKKTDT
jgi:hypothetical protein